MRRFGPRLLVGILSVGVVCVSCSPASAPAGPPHVTAATVQRTTFEQQITASGYVVSPQQVTVQPQTSGRVQKVFADVGSTVHAGDLLAELDSDAPQVALQQALANLAVAQAKLQGIQAGARPENVAQAAEALAGQQAKLAAMLAGGRTEDVAAAQAGMDAQTAKLNALERGNRPEIVQQAQSQLDAAQQKLALLQKGVTDDVRQSALSAVQSDTSALAAAEAQYAALGGTSAADLQNLSGQVQTLQAQVASAQSAVDAADAALANLAPTTQADVQAAQTAVDQAQASLNAAQAALEDSRHPTQTSITQAQAALDAANAQRAAAEANQTALEQKVGGVCAPVVNPTNGQSIQQPNSTACGDAKAAAEAAVQAGNSAVDAAQGQLDLLRRGGAPSVQVALQSQLASAVSLVKATQARLNAVSTTGREAQRAQLQSQKDQAVAQLNAAQNSLATAQAQLVAAQNGSVDAQRKLTAAQVDAARQKLATDQAHLDQLTAGPEPEDIQAAQDAVDQAAAQLAIAQHPTRPEDIAAQQALLEQAHQQLLKAQQPYSDFDIQQQEHAVAQAEAALRASQTPYTDQDLAMAAATVDQAQAGVQQAQLTLDHSRITAPVDGTVLVRSVSPGTLVGPESTIVTLTPPAVEIDATVDQTRIALVQIGQSVSVQAAPFPDETFTGSVVAVTPAVDPKTHTGTVSVAPVDTDHQLRAGMQTMLRITSVTPDALVVPRDAVLGNIMPGSTATVITVDADRTDLKSVQLAAINDHYVQVASGLAPGERVATGNLSNLTSGQSVTVTPLTAEVPNAQ